MILILFNREYFIKDILILGLLCHYLQLLHVLFSDEVTCCVTFPPQSESEGDMLVKQKIVTQSRKLRGPFKIKAVNCD